MVSLCTSSPTNRVDCSMDPSPVPEAPRQTIRRDPRSSTHRDDGSPLQAGYGHEVSIIHLLGLTLAVPDHATLSRRAATLDVPRLRSGTGAEPMHLLVDSTGLKLCDAGEWLVEKHGTKTRRAWRKLHIGMDANTGEILATVLTTKDVDDASQVGPLLDQVEGPIASFTGDGAYDQDSVYRAVIERDPDAVVVVPPRATAVLRETAETEPIQRDRHLQCIAETGRMGWQKVSGYNARSRIENAMGRYKQVI